MHYIAEPSGSEIFLTRKFQIIFTVKISQSTVHTYRHTYIHTYIHTYMHTYTHTYQVLVPALLGWLLLWNCAVHMCSYPSPTGECYKQWGCWAEEPRPQSLHCHVDCACWLSTCCCFVFHFHFFGTILLGLSLAHSQRGYTPAALMSDEGMPSPL